MAMAHIRVGEIARQTGALDDAVAHYQQSISLWDKLVAEKPTSYQYQVYLVHALSHLGEVLLPLAAD